jgi:hypothetical protein
MRTNGPDEIDAVSPCQPFMAPLWNVIMLPLNVTVPEPPVKLGAL